MLAAHLASYSARLKFRLRSCIVVTNINRIHVLKWGVPGIQPTPLQGVAGDMGHLDVGGLPRVHAAVRR